MKLDKFTEKAQEALQGAAEMARERGQQAVEPKHVLLALMREEEGVARTLLERAGASVRALDPELVSVVERFPKVSGGRQPYISPALNTALERAEKEAERLKDEYISTEHLLLALADNKALKDAGATHDALLNALRQIRGSQRVTDQNPESKYQGLEKYGRDLTKLAQQGKLDPVIGRDEEIRRVIQVLSRRTKNNPVLIGEPGVGKTWDPVYGARPLKRAIQRLLQDPLAMMLLEGKFGEGDTVKVDAKGGDIIFTKATSPAPVAAAS